MAERSTGSERGNAVTNGERSLAIFIDFENLALGFQSRRDRFDIVRVLERLVEKGKIVAKKAYADWNRFSGYTSMLHEAAIELIEIPRRAQTGKNSADIHLCVDAMDLAYSKDHINTFVVVSGDSDFSPLVSKLKELGKHVIGLGMQESTSDLLRDNCDEFIYYEDLGQTTSISAPIELKLPETKRKVFTLLMDSLLALRRENKEVLWSSMIKDTMKRKKPSFNESYHGYRTFSELLEDAAKQGLIELDTDKRSRTYVVSRFGSEMHATPTPPPPKASAVKKAEAPAVKKAEAPIAIKAEAPEGDAPVKKKSSRRRRTGKKRPLPASGPVGEPMSLAEIGVEMEIARLSEEPLGMPDEEMDAEPIPDDEVTFPRLNDESHPEEVPANGDQEAAPHGSSSREDEEIPF
jgi:uncharacterized protein (TIGR00288 family)